MAEFLLILFSIPIVGFAGVRYLRHLSVPREQRSVFVASVVLIGTATAFTAHEMYRPPIAELDVLDRPVRIPAEGYATSDRCQACHPGEHASWNASYHSRMTQIASPDTVLGDFGDRALVRGSAKFHLSRRGDEYWIEMPDIDGQSGKTRVVRRVVLTTGSHHMQAYWYATDDSRVLGLLPFVHNTETGDWLPRDASFLTPPHEEPVSELGRWNKVCLECHVTLGRLRPIPADSGGGHDTRVTEFGIGCESCHGPGEDHAASYRNPVYRYGKRLAPGPADDIVHPARLDHRRSTEVCGQCHATSIWTSQSAIDRFAEHGFAYRPGDVLAHTKAVVRGRLERNPPEVRRALAQQPRLIANTFWPDGMNRIAGREYNGLLETPCFTQGEMSCLSCHRMHAQRSDAAAVEAWRDDQLRVDMRGPPACTQCHFGYADEAGAMRHTHHRPGSTGSNCMDCHMPHTTYGLLKAVRSHQIDSPSVSASIETGRPNACNQCHLDRPLSWTAAWLDRWYGIESPELGETERRVASIPLMALQGDAGQRALAAWSLGWQPALDVSGDEWPAMYLSLLLGDPYPAVRQIAWRSLRRMPGFDDFPYDPLAPGPELLERANAALQHWAVRFRRSPELPESVLIAPEGPRTLAVMELLRHRDDRLVAFAE